MQNSKSSRLVSMKNWYGSNNSLQISKTAQESTKSPFFSWTYKAKIKGTKILVEAGRVFGARILRVGQPLAIPQHCFWLLLGKGGFGLSRLGCPRLSAELTLSLMFHLRKPTTTYVSPPPGKSERSSVTTSSRNILLLVQSCMCSSMPWCFSRDTRHKHAAKAVPGSESFSPERTRQHHQVSSADVRRKLLSEVPDQTIQAVPPRNLPLVRVILLPILWVTSASHLLCILEPHNSSTQRCTTQV